MKIKQSIRSLVAFTLFVSTSIANAGFPDDFSDVIWIDPPQVANFPVTATVTANVRGSALEIQDTKRSVWPRRFHTILGNSCCNRSLWIFIKFEDQWYAATFEFMRFGQIIKSAEAVNGGQIRRPPFSRPGFVWRPAEGEVYGFMTSGMARFDLVNLNVRERSNVALYRWEVGPTDNVDFEEVPRGADGRPIEGGVEGPETPGEPEICVEPEAPEPVNNTHTFNGIATGSLAVTGVVNSNADYNEDITFKVQDNRSLTFNVDDQSFSTEVAADGSFEGTFVFDLLGQCEIDITVNGNVNGTNATGNASGSDSCLGNTATLTATFAATSPTAPSFLDQRPSGARPARVCPFDLNLAPIMNLLLEQD